MASSTNTLIPARLGDDTAVSHSLDQWIENPETVLLGSGDCSLIKNYISSTESKEMLHNLLEKEIDWQQWFHMPKEDDDIDALRRLKQALGVYYPDGYIAHYRFPVNNQSQHGVADVKSSPTIYNLLQRVNTTVGQEFNHVVVLLYRGKEDCIGFHKDKDVDLDPDAPIVSISLTENESGRPYILRDNIHHPTKSQKFNLPNGALFMLGPQTNKEYYHSVPKLEEETGIRISITFRKTNTFYHPATGDLKGKGVEYNTVDWPIELRGNHISVPEPSEVLDFWFGPSDKEKNSYRSSVWWFGISPEHPEINSLDKMDDYLTQKYQPILNSLLKGGYPTMVDQPHILYNWMKTWEGQMATLILLDQFSRNIFRGDARSFAFDSLSQSVVKVLLPQMKKLPLPYQIFVCLALIHYDAGTPEDNVSKVSEGHFGIVKLASEIDSFSGINVVTWKKEMTKLVRVSDQHLDVVKRFGRYPHRNDVLSRKSTPEETKFLQGKNLPRWMVGVNAKPAKISLEGVVSGHRNKLNPYTQVSHKLRLLVLHSNRQSAMSFRVKTKHNLEDKLGKEIELIYCDAPTNYYPAGEVKDFVEKEKITLVPNVGSTKSWWNATDDPKTMVYRGLEESITHIDKLFSQGNYDGILGFSQGGALTGIIAGLVDKHRLGKSVPVPVANIAAQLKLVVIISGFYCRDTRPEFALTQLGAVPDKHAPEMVYPPSQLIQIPSFHSWGLSDELVDPWRSEKLSQLFEKPMVKTHDRAHFAKAIKFWPVKEIKQFLNKYIPSNKDMEEMDKIADSVLDAPNTIKQFVIDYPKKVDTLGEYVITSGKYTNNEIYYAFHYLYSDVEKAIYQMGKKNALIWKHLVEQDIQGKNEDLQPYLVTAIARQLVEDYQTYLIDKQEGSPTKTALFAPKYNATYKNSGILFGVADKIARLINIYGKEVSTVEVDTLDEKGLQNYKKQIYIQYTRILSQLRKLILPPQPTKVIKRRVTRRNWEDQLKKPLNDFIVNPRAEPVEIAPPEQLRQLHQFLRDEAHNIGTQVDDKVILTRGIYGRKDQTMDLCKQVIGPPGVKDLIKSLELDSTSADPKVKHLLLGNNVCGNGLASEVARFIASGKSKLTTWYIAGNDMSGAGILPLCQVLKSDTQVKQLWLKRNPLRLEGAKNVSAMLAKNNTLEVLDLTNTAMMDEGAIEVLSHLGKLKHLYLSSNGLTEKTCQKLKEVLLTSQLETLSLGCNRLGDAGAEYIAEALAHPDCPLLSLEVASCAIGKKGGIALAKAVANNTRLMKLNLGLLKSTTDLDEVPNNLENAAAMEWGKTLSANTTLRSLDLTHTGIAQEGIKAISEGLKMNSQLIYCNVEQFGIPHNELSRELIRASIDKNRYTLVGDEKVKVDSVLEPPHIREIISYYRVN